MNSPVISDYGEVITLDSCKHYDIFSSFKTLVNIGSSTLNILSYHTTSIKINTYTKFLDINN